MNTSKLLITSLLAAAAMGAVPAWAENVALTNGMQTALTISSGVAGAGNTYTYTAPEEGTTDNGGWLWLNNLLSTGNVALGSSVPNNMTLSGSGLIVLGYQGGNGGVVYNFDFTNTDASAFSGKFAVVNQWDNETVAKLSGTGWSNVEYVFAGVSREQNWVTKRGYGNSSRGDDTLALQGATTLAGITGTSKGYSPAAEANAVAAGIGNINLRESITVATSGTVLTLSGAGTYEFYGSVGTESARVGVSMTGTGAQTLGGTTYLDNLSVTNGELVLSGTTNIAGTTTITGGTLDISAGTTTFGGALTLSGGNVAIGTLGDETRAAVAAAGAVTISNSVGVMLSGNAKNGTFAVFSGSTLSNTGTLTLSATNSGFAQNWTTDGNVTYVTISGAANNALVWGGGTDSWTWNTSDVKWKLFGSETVYRFTTGDDVKFATAGAQIAFDNNTEISAGAITIAADTTFSGTAQKLSATGSITVWDGANLQLEGRVLGSITGGINLVAEDSVVTLKDIAPPNGNQLYGSGKVVLNQTSSNTFSITASVFTGGISLEKIGTGTVSLEAAQTYTGGTKLSDGVLQVKNNSALGTGALTMNGGTLQAGANNHTLANAVNVAADSEVNTQTHAMALSGVITGTGTLTKQGTGTLVLTNNGNAFAGAIVSAGTLVVGAANGAIGEIKTGADARIFASPETAGSIVVESGAAFKTHLGGGTTIDKGAGVGTDLKTFAGNFYLKDGATLGNIDGHVKLAGNIVFGATDTTGAYSTDATVTLTQHWQKTVELAGVLSGAGTVKLTSPTAQENNAFYKISGDENTFSGTYKLENATNKTSTLVLSSQNAAKDAKVNLSTSGARIFLGAANVTIAGLEGVSGSTIRLTTESGAPSASTLTVNQATNTTFSGTIADGIALKKAGAGTLILNGANTYRGGTVIEAGTLVAGSASALGTTKGVEVKSGATLNLGTSAVTVAGLSGAGAVGFAGGMESSTLTVNGGGVFSGTLTSVSLVKQGADSTLELSNVQNWISSATVESGTLRIAPGTGVTEVSGSSYSCMYTGSVSVADGAKLEIAPNLSVSDSTGLNATSGVTFAAGARLFVDVAGASENDVLAIITSSVIQYNNGTENVGLTSDNLDSFVNDFVTLKGWNGLADWSYVNDKLSVTLTIPEPSVFGLLAGLGALALAGTRRRRRKA